MVKYYIRFLVFLNIFIFTNCLLIKNKQQLKENNYTISNFQKKIEVKKTLEQYEDFGMEIFK
jgi:hypothetical protein